MTNRVLDLSERPARLRAENSVLIIQFGVAAAERGRHTDGGGSGAADSNAIRERSYRCEHLGDPDRLTIPFRDIAVLIASHPQISLTQAVLSALGAAGGIFVTCDERHMPAAMSLPLVVHSLQTERFAEQASMALPKKKRLWKEIVRAKIQAQARLLEQRTASDRGLSALSGRVRSGDAGNLEAYAARIYWKALFGENGFRRDPESGGVNACLNYGYAVLRAIVARALCGAGLHPSLGLHHHNRYDPFCLADDLMEPFRPLVDGQVARIAEGPGKDFPLDREAKRIVLEALLGRFTADHESRTLFDWVSRSAASLAATIEGTGEAIEVPSLERSEQPVSSEGLE